LWILIRCSIQFYVIKFICDLREVGGFLRVLQFPPPIKLTAMMGRWNIVESGVKLDYHNLCMYKMTIFYYNNWQTVKEDSFIYVDWTWTLWNPRQPLVTLAGLWQPQIRYRSTFCINKQFDSHWVFPVIKPLCCQLVMFSNTGFTVCTCMC
jgi:hypothetical protein